MFPSKSVCLAISGAALAADASALVTSVTCRLRAESSPSTAARFRDSSVAPTRWSRTTWRTSLKSGAVPFSSAIAEQARTTPGTKASRGNKETMRIGRGTLLALNRGTRIHLHGHRLLLAGDVHAHFHFRVGGRAPRRRHGLGQVERGGARGLARHLVEIHLHARRRAALNPLLGGLLRGRALDRNDLALHGGDFVGFHLVHGEP